jgi:hypothetical protein
MKTFSVASLMFAALAVAAPAQDWVERIDDFLSVSAFHGNVRARLSGTLDLEAYHVEQPAPGLLFTGHDFLFNPRLTFFLDVQIGAKLYAFAQTRIDRGFDPGDNDARMRLDEYALRYTPWEDGRFNLQAGKFATVVGNWTKRHLSWDNPFVTAPVPYENTTGIWDQFAPGDAQTLLFWSNALPGQTAQAVYGDKYQRVPIIWGPSYATGLSVSGQIGDFEYAAEVKNSALSSRPHSWDVGEVGFDHPTFSGRFGWSPNQMWNLGVSLSAGPYLLDTATPFLLPGQHIGDYREWVLGQDISFAWHHLQLWAEFYETRFEVPTIGHVDTFAYYLEAKYKFTPQLFGALRWNQQLFGNIRETTLVDGIHEETQSVRWGRNLWRIDAALGYRFTEHTQLKLQWSIQQEDWALHEFTNTLAAQFTLRF